LLIEYNRRDLDERMAHFGERTAVGIDARQFLDEADITVTGPEEDGGEGDDRMFHVQNRMPTPSM